jgi:hypothetical protein
MVKKIHGIESVLIFFMKANCNSLFISFIFIIYPSADGKMNSNYGYFSACPVFSSETTE